MAAIVGIKFGKRKLPGQQKSVEGSIACFLSTFVFGVLYYIFDLQLGLSLVTIMLGAATATLAEAWNIRFDDNFKIPLLSGMVMYLASIIFL